jgi:hypothetical protein
MLVTLLRRDPESKLPMKHVAGTRVSLKHHLSETEITVKRESERGEFITAYSDELFAQT